VDVRLTKASQLCEELLEEVSALQPGQVDFADSAKARLTKVHSELRQHEVVTDRQIATMREIAGGLDARRPPRRLQ
jgi:hypothetical protein